MKILGYAYTTGSITDPAVTFTNISRLADGTAALDANGYFVASNLPALQSTIPGSGSIAVDLIFKTQNLGKYGTTFVIWTDGGMAYSTLNATASSPAAALVQVSTLAGGWTTVPHCPTSGVNCTFYFDMGTSPGLTSTTLTIKVTNTGGSALVFQKSKPPIDPALGAANPNSDFFEGQSVNPGESSVANIIFSPPAATLNAASTVYSGIWTLNVNDVTFGVHFLNFSARWRRGRSAQRSAAARRASSTWAATRTNVNARIEPNNVGGATNENGACQSAAAAEGAVFAGAEYSSECWIGGSVPLSQA